MKILLKTICVGLFLGASIANAQDLLLQINRSNNAMKIINPFDVPLSMKGYTIGSESMFLDPTGWTSLTDAASDGWLEANPVPAHLSELNRNSSLLVGPGASVDLGTPYMGSDQTPAQEDVFFEYITSDLQIVTGQIEYLGPANDLTVYVDPSTGQSVMANLSSTIEPITIKGYSILSSSEALAADSWTSFETTGNAGDGWLEANPNASNLSELNRNGEVTFGSNTERPLGQILTPGSEARDLVFEYFTSSGEIRRGTVQYSLVGGNGLVGDCDGNGVINTADLACACAAGEIDDVLAATGLLRGDLDGNGNVGFQDFVTLSANFGKAVDSYTLGDLDCNGQVAFQDFVTLSANFGKSSEAALSAVPEPTAASIAVALLLGCATSLRRRRTL